MKTFKDIQKSIDSFTKESKHYIINNSITNNSITKHMTLSQVGLLLLSLIMIFYVIRHFMYYNIVVPSINAIEGFDNKNKNFVFKKDMDIFDDFYANIYDSLVYNDVKNSFELGKLQSHSIIGENSKILDIGSGTGHHIAQLLETNKILENDSIIGIDVSKAMVEKSRDTYPQYKSCFKHNDIMKGSLFRDNTFSHILCLYFTIYYIKDKTRLFKNCHHWLQDDGIMMLHLVDADKFDPIVPAGNPLEIVNIQNYADKRITNSKVIFNGFQYQSNFNYKPTENIGTFNEKFIFKDGKTRENEHTFYMEDKKDIIHQAQKAGFVVKNIIHMHKCGYENQYLYLLEKS